ncbi:hypothetical protein GCM10009801_23050 [Streptomyces albiaxialis]|uniref:Uncharacterized protein n=1 Tax=Streptomyces albiaxialis TaxID=329523 RepID=A0ABN2VSU1_9ACTN
MIARPEVSALGILLGERCYHEPDLVVGLAPDGLTQHVARVQAEVVENFRQHELEFAAQLLSDLNRFVTRLGNLSPERQGLLRGEARRRLSEQERVTLAGNAERAPLWEADWRQLGLRRQLREAQPSGEPGTDRTDTRGSGQGIRR